MTAMNLTPPQTVEQISKYVSIPADEVTLLADLQVPEDAHGLILFVYGFGRCRNHPRTRLVARVMRESGLGTLLCDLLTEEEDAEDEVSGIYRRDASFLAKRLLAVTRWAVAYPDTKDIPIGYFGASTGGGAAMIAAVKMHAKVAAVVSRGGRLDLAVKALPHVKCPVLLIVGEYDTVGVELSRQALPRLTGEKELRLVPGASQLFGEPGKLEIMAELSAAWFRCHLGEPGRYL
jgi:dienelactone hydrolase